MRPFLLFSSRFLFPFSLSIILSFASPSFSDLPFVAREGMAVAV
jgi:hypothetical protein